VAANNLAVIQDEDRIGNPNRSMLAACSDLFDPLE
jgi:hypothetical protein